jgi:hypothetical protein
MLDELKRKGGASSGSGAGPRGKKASTVEDELAALKRQVSKKSGKEPGKP